MSNIITDFESRMGLSLKQCCTLIDVPLPTYYQYRRTDVMPNCIRRFLEILITLDDAILDRIVDIFLNGATHGVDDDEL